MTPTVAVSIDSVDVNVPNPTATVTFAFNTAPASFTLADTSAVGGTLSNLQQIDATDYMATFTAAANTDIATASVAVTAGSWQAGSDNVGAGGATPEFTVDTVTPTVSTITASPASGEANAGAVITLTFTMSEGVTVTGVPVLALDDGGTATYNAAATAALGDPTKLVFTATVANAQNAATLAVTGNNLNGSTIAIANTSGNEADLSGADVGFPGLAVGAAVKSITATMPSADLGPGKVVTFTVTTTEAVTIGGLTAATTPYLTLNDGGTAAYRSGSGTGTLIFAYAVGALGSGQNTPALAVTGFNPNGATVYDSGNVADTAGLAGVTAYTTGPQIDTVAPTVASVLASPATADLDAGNTVTLTVNFSETVYVANSGAPYLALSDGGKAAYAGGTGSSAVAFTYTVAAGQNTADLTVAGLVLNGGTIRDGAGNNAILTGAVTNPAGTLQIDTTAPAVTERLYSDTGVSATDKITANDELTGGGDPNAAVTFTIDGAAGGTATAASAGVWTYTPAGLANGPHTIVATETDGAGNVGTASLSFTLDTVAPTVTSIATSVVNGDLDAGKSVTFTVDFSAPVYATATQYLQLNDNGHAIYAGGSGSTLLTFTYVVAGGQNTPNLAVTALSSGLTEVAGNKAVLNGVATNPGGTLQIDTIAPAVTERLYSDTGVSGTDKITDNAEIAGTGDPNAVVNLTIDGVTGATATAGSTGVWTYTPTGLADGPHTIVASETDGAGNTGAASLSFALDTTAPTVVSPITTSVTDGDLDAGNTITFTVDFSTAVYATATQYLQLNDNGHAIYASGSGSTQLTFTYAVVANQNTPNLAVTALSTGLTDMAGNKALLNGVASNPGGTLQIDTIAPAVTERLYSDTGVSGTDKITDNDEIAGGGDPNAVVNLTIDGVAGATAMAGTTGAWTYTPTGLADGAHTVVASETDGAGNTDSATLTFTLDTTAPIVESVAANPVNGDLDAGKTVTLTIAFNANVYVTGAPYLALNDNGRATYSSGSGSDTLTFTYTVGAGQNTPDLAVSSLMFNGGTIRDIAGNNAVTTAAAGSLSGAIQIDTTAPTITSVVTSGTGITAGSGVVGAGSIVTLTVNTSEAVTAAGGTPSLTLNDGGTAVYTGSAGPNALTFSYTVAAGQNTPDLTVTGLALNGATIQDGAGNNAVLTGAVTNPAGTLEIDTLAPTLVGAAGGLQINLRWDSSVVSAPAAFQTAVEDAALLYTQLFANPEVINIQVGYGEIEGQALETNALAESDSNGYLESYATVAAALRQDAVSSTYQTTADASLPASDPTNGGQFYVASAEAKALGQVSGTTTGIDGYVSLSSKYSFDYTPITSSTPISAGQFDAIGTMEHEISEAMGRVGSLGSLFSANWYTPLDLFRYSSSGVRDLTPGPGYFSINGGATNLGTYNNPVNGGDAADWIPSLQGDSYGDGYPGIAAVVSPNDIIEDSVLGYTMTPLAVANTETTGLAVAPTGPSTAIPNDRGSTMSIGTAARPALVRNPDLAATAFGTPATLGFGTSGGIPNGTPSVGDGGPPANISLLGNYLASSFVAASDGHGGTFAADPPPAPQSVLAPHP